MYTDLGYLGVSSASSEMFWHLYETKLDAILVLGSAVVPTPIRTTFRDLAKLLEKELTPCSWFVFLKSAHRGPRL